MYLVIIIQLEVLELPLTTKLSIFSFVLVFAISMVLFWGLVLWLFQYLLRKDKVRYNLCSFQVLNIQL